MSDVVKTVGKTVKIDIEKVNAFFKKAGELFIAFVKKFILAPITDKDFDIDIYRLGGIAAYVVSGIIAMKTANQVLTLSEAKLGIMAGLVSAIAAIGTALFTQARKNDAPGA